ncbi:MAG: hypothetical protein IPP81_12920 [Chitinophagaceae bacterium]|nr:hypothetical protein [Chitinophagaceae bacterium]
METIKVNPKALNLDSAKQSHVKVTIGFKCPPPIKLDLAEKAQKLGLTLSEYVENLVMNFVKIIDQIKFHEKDENARLTSVIKEQMEKIEFYEHDFLKEIFRQYKNQTAEFKNQRNEIVKLKLTDIKAVYSLIINSYQIHDNHDHSITISSGEINPQ